MKALTFLLSLCLLAGTALAVNPVLFQVHMSIQQEMGNFNPATDQVVVRGSFNNWSGNSPSLIQNEDNIYQGSFNMEDYFIGQELMYKFVIVGEYDFWEECPMRSITPLAGGQTLAPVWFGDISWDDILQQPVTVHFAINLRSVRHWFEQYPGQSHHGLSSFEEVAFVGVCGSFEPYWSFGTVPLEHQLTPVTPAGDWFEGAIVFDALSPSRIMYKLGANGHDNEADLGVHYEMTIDDASPHFYVSHTFGELDNWWGCPPPRQVEVLPPTDGVHLSWESIPSASLFRVYGADFGYGPFYLLGQSSVPHFIDTDPPVAQRRFYRVVADCD